MAGLKDLAGAGAFGLLPMALAQTQTNKEQPWPAPPTTPPTVPPVRPHRTIVPQTADEERRRDLHGRLPPLFGGTGNL